jgi:hypothetical protein
MWQFTADKGNTVQVPFLEDAKANNAPNYASSREPEQAISDVIAILGILGVGFLGAIAGQFSANGVKRYGYVIRFALGTGIGEIRVAGLPMKTETADKIRRAKVQSLLTARDLFQAIHQTRMFIPGAEDFLMLYMLVDPVNKPGVTVRDHLRANGNMPQLPDAIQIDKA